VAVRCFTGFHISLGFVWVVVFGGGLTYVAVVALIGAVVALEFVYAAFFACINY
jgi:hypothetical protein